MQELDEKLKQAAQAAREGNGAEARRLLIEIIKVNPRHEGALMGMASLTTGEERAKILQRVLLVNPNNEKARDLLARSGYGPTMDDFSSKRATGTAPSADPAAFVNPFEKPKAGQTVEMPQSPFSQTPFGGPTYYPPPPPHIFIPPVPVRRSRSVGKWVVIVAVSVVIVCVGIIAFGALLGETELAITDNPYSTFEAGDVGRDIAFSGDGSMVAVAVDEQIKVFDANTHKLLYTFENPRRTYNDLGVPFDHFVYEIRWLWGGSTHLALVWTTGDVSVWDMNNGTPYERTYYYYDSYPVRGMGEAEGVTNTFYIYHLTEDQLGMRIAYPYEGTVTDEYFASYKGDVAWELNYLQNEILFDVDRESVAVSPEAAAVAVAGRTHLEIYNTWPLQIRYDLTTADVSNAVAWSPDGRYVAVGTDKHTVKIYDFQDGMAVERTLESDLATTAVFDVEWTADGQWVLGKYEEEVRVWNAETGELHRVLDAGEFIIRIAVHPNNTRVAAITAAGDVMLWNIPE